MLVHKHWPHDELCITITQQHHQQVQYHSPFHHDGALLTKPQAPNNKVTGSPWSWSLASNLHAAQRQTWSFGWCHLGSGHSKHGSSDGAFPPCPCWQRSDMRRCPFWPVDAALIPVDFIRMVSKTYVDQLVWWLMAIDKRYLPKLISEASNINSNLPHHYQPSFTIMINYQPSTTISY